MGLQVGNGGLRGARHVLRQPGSVAEHPVFHNPVRLTAIHIPLNRNAVAGDGGGVHIVDRTAGRGHREFYIIHIASVIIGERRLHHHRNIFASTRVRVEIDRKRLIIITNKTDGVHRHESACVEQVAQHTHNQSERICRAVLPGNKLELQVGYRIGGHIQAGQNGILVTVSVQIGSVSVAVEEDRIGS